MTDQEAHEVAVRGEQLAKKLLIIAATVAGPGETMVALALAAGFTFANMEFDEGTDMEEVFQDWLSSVKAQYEETRKKIEAYRNTN